MKSLKETLAPLFLIILGASTVYGACTYIQDGGYNKCTTDSLCSTYSTPTPTTCADNQSSTGAQPGNTKTNVVTLTNYSGGHCESSVCTGGTSSTGNSQTNVDHYCIGCQG